MKIMKAVGCVLASSALVFTGFAVMCGIGAVLGDNATKPLKVDWMNDAVFYSTNNYMYDEERNKTNDNPALIYNKTVVTTNKPSPFYFLARDRRVELGMLSRRAIVLAWQSVLPLAIFCWAKLADMVAPKSSAAVFAMGPFHTLGHDCDTSEQCRGLWRRCKVFVFAQTSNRGCGNNHPQNKGTAS